MGKTPEAQVNKIKNRHMGLYQTEKLLSKKGKKSAESTNKMGANI
jgi:hypothetical protein